MSKFLTPPVWYDKNGNLVEILTGISKDGGVGIGEGANAESGAVIIGNGESSTSASNGDNRVWIGYTATEYPTVDMKPVVIGTIRSGSFSDYGSDSTTVSGSVLIGGSIYHNYPNLNINGSTIINSKVVMPIGEKNLLQNVIAIGYQSGGLGATSNYIQIGSSDQGYTFKVGNKDVFAAINMATSVAGTAKGTADDALSAAGIAASEAATAANTFAIDGVKYKATYDSASATLNFVTA